MPAWRLVERRMNMEASVTKKTVARGFTLIEMLVVVSILVILTGAILPKLDVVQLKVNKGVAANNMGGVSRYVQTYRVMHNIYPDHWDSLMGGTTGSDPTSLWAGPAGGLGPGLEPQTTGALAGSPHKLTTTTLTESATVHELRSLTRLGIVTIEQLGGTTGDIPGNLYNQDQLLAAGSTVATINDADPDGQNIISQIYKLGGTSTSPVGYPATVGEKLVVFGFGPKNSTIQDVLQECPWYPNTDPNKYYHRFLCIFRVFQDGTRCQLAMVTGADGDRIDEEIGDYYAEYTAP